MKLLEERFADIQMLRYQLYGFSELTLKEKELIYYLSQATLFGRDITFDQNGAYNLRIRKVLEAIATDRLSVSDEEVRYAIEDYLKRVWFANGIHHHYGSDKFVPGFSEEQFRHAVRSVDASRLPLKDGQTVDSLLDELCPVMFNPDVHPKRVSHEKDADLVAASACNFYQDGIGQDEAVGFYAKMKDDTDPMPPSYGLNSTLVRRDDGRLEEEVWHLSGKYGKAIAQIVYWLKRAMDVAESTKQKEVISLLIRYYETGDLRLFDEYSIKWVDTTDTTVDFINGFIEVYGDPLGIKATWEGLVEYVDAEATARARKLSSYAQWFEDHSPVDSRFRKSTVKGVTASVICAAMLGGEEYPSTAIGINLPNADWIRAQHGSKSITISNITKAYEEASKNSGMRQEFIFDTQTREMIDRYGAVTDDLHTALHECLGHGSGQLLPGVSPDALLSYSSTIEEARADLFGLYYIADEKMVELGLLNDSESYKAHYYSYMLNGLLTQLVRIEPGKKIEEAHMRNRALIARWCMDNGHVLHLVRKGGKTYLEITDYAGLRALIARLLAEVQRIKSEGDIDAARHLIETYAVDIDKDLHAEVLQRYRQLNLAPYKGFINPQLLPVYDEAGNLSDVEVYYGESYSHQMLRYSTEYSTLI